MRAFTTADFRALLEKDDSVIVLDCRSADDFADAHVPGAIFIPEGPQFEEWITALIPEKRALLLVCPPDIREKVTARLKKSGKSDPLGWLDDSLETWKKAQYPYHLVIRVEADELAMDLPYDERLLVVDVRTEAEFAEGHVRDAMNIPMRSLSDTMTLSLIEEEQHLYICGPSDDKSMMAASVLLHQGYTQLRTVDGGWDAIRKQKGIPLEKEKDKLN